MLFENSNNSTKSKIFQRDIFDQEFLNEKDDALKPIEFFNEIDDEIDVGSLISKSEIKERKSKVKNKSRNSDKFKSNIVIIDTASENSSDSTFSDQIQKEIEKIKEKHIIK